MNKTIRIYCDNGHPAWTIAALRHVHPEDYWEEFGAQSNALRREHRAAVAASDSSSPAGDAAFWQSPAFADKPAIGREVVGGKESGMSRMAGMRVRPTGFDESGVPIEVEHAHVTYTFRCEKCRNKNRHATFTRRDDKLFPLLARLSALGIERITVDGLAKAAGHHDRAQIVRKR